MRTRIALVAITSIALITVTILTQAVSVQPARAAARLPHRSTLSSRVRHRDRLTSVVSSRSPSSTTATTTKPTTRVKTVSSRTTTATGTTTAALPPLAMGIDLLAGLRVGTKEAAPVVPTPAVAPAPVATPADTVTPYERSAWDRVAMCEEGGNWRADNSRFSGGLGITRANWVEYGGLRYASEGALATPDQQIMVAERIQSGPPDQDGCSGW